MIVLTLMPTTSICNNYCSGKMIPSHYAGFLSTLLGIDVIQPNGGCFYCEGTCCHRIRIKSGPWLGREMSIIYLSKINFNSNRFQHFKVKCPVSALFETTGRRKLRMQKPLILAGKFLWFERMLFITGGLWLAELFITYCNLKVWKLIVGSCLWFNRRKVPWNHHTTPCSCIPLACGMMSYILKYFYPIEMKLSFFKDNCTIYDLKRRLFLYLLGWGWFG